MAEKNGQTPAARDTKQKWDARTREKVVLAYMADPEVLDDFAAVGQKYGVPEQTVRAWVAKELNNKNEENGVLERTYRENTWETRYRAAAGMKHTVAHMQRRVASGELKDTDTERYATVLAKLAEKPAEEEAESEDERSGVVVLAEVMAEDSGQNVVDSGQWKVVGGP
jgi:sugar diacid utilization regulator